MAQFDTKGDTTPKNPLVTNGKPYISAMRTALSTFSSTTYTAAVLDAMTKIDMKKACADNNLTVDGL